jgi:putative oxidoreductase
LSFCELNLRVLDGPMPPTGITRAERNVDRRNTMIRLPKAALWVCAIFLAVAFVFVGVSKLEGPSAIRWAERFVNWGYPANAQYVIGVLEILGGLGVVIPRWRRAAAATLVALMIGALGTHAVKAEFPRLIPPLILGGLAFLMYSAHPRPGREDTPHPGIRV